MKPDPLNVTPDRLCVVADLVLGVIDGHNGAAQEARLFIDINASVLEVDEAVEFLMRLGFIERLRKKL